MSYIDGKIINGKVWVSEKKDGVRNVYSTHPKYVYYYVDPEGTYTSIFGDKLKKFSTLKKREFEKSLEAARDRGLRIFESDINPLYRFLEEKYPENDGPQLNVSFLDIETDKDPARGYSRINNPYSAITAITIYNKWEEKCYTIMLTPPNMTTENAVDLLSGKIGQNDIGEFTETINDEFGVMTEDDGYFVVDTEAELLMIFFEIIADADILSHWNGEFYDIPYLVLRTRIVLGGEDLVTIVQEDGSKENPQAPSEASMPWLLKFGLFPSIPTIKMTEKFGSIEKTFQINGRVSLDYMALYKKFRMIERHSYKLANILKIEIKQGKVEYEGSLDQLYRFDFRRFCAYNRQDVVGLVHLDEALRYIDLANAMAHQASITFDKTTGSVAKIEGSVIKRLHETKRICFDRVEKSKNQKAPGAYVIEPKFPGLYDDVASYDLTSMYPKIMEAINISPECIIGQFDLTKTEARYHEALLKELDYVDPLDASDAALKKAHVEAWKYFTGVLEFHNISDETADMETLVFENGDEITATAKEWKTILREQNWSISANGTVFDLNMVGILTECITIWFADRASTKKKSQQYDKKAEKEEDPVKKAEYKALAKYYDVTQQAKKIFLNSIYGSLLNNYFRFYDGRMGRSVTLTGRCITKHMARTADRLLEEMIDE